MAETDALYRIARAKELLEDPLLTAAFDQLTRTEFEAMMDKGASDEELRQHRDRINAARDVRKSLKTLIESEEQKIKNAAAAAAAPNGGRVIP